MKNSTTLRTLFVFLFRSAFQTLLLKSISSSVYEKNKNYHLLTKSLTVILFSTISWVSNAQTSGPYSYFESFRAQASRASMITTDGWSFSSTAVTPATAVSNARSGNNFLSLGNIVGYNAVTPVLNNPDVFKFYYKSSSATNNVTFRVDWSKNNFVTTLGSVTGVVTQGSTHQPLILNTSNFGINASLKFRIKITSTVSAAALFIDDMSCVSRIGSENNIIVPELGSLTSYQTVPPLGGNASSVFKFYDQGGQYDNYNKSQTQINYFAPTNAWDKVKITFNSFNTEASTKISVYNWDGVTATPLLANFAGTNANNLPSPAYYTTLNPGDSLKVVYVSGTTQSNSQNLGYDCNVESVSYLSISGLSTTSSCVGTPLTINGTSLSNATSVTINGVGATINSNSTTQLEVTPVAGSIGTGVVSVTTTLGVVTYGASITITSTTIPTFTPIAPITYGATLNSLSTNSLEGITGAWSPTIDNTTTTTYTFTPDIGQCATTTTMTISVYPIPNPADITLTPGGRLETIFDQFGNKYSLKNISTEPKPNITNKAQMLSSTVLCSSGIFDLYFEAGSGMEGNTAAEIDRRNVVCQVFSDLSNFINSPLHNVGNTTRVKIWVRDITQIPNINSATLGLATGFYSVPSSPNAIIGGIVDNEIWKTIHAGVDSYTNVYSPVISTSGVNFSVESFYHGMIAINPNANWNIDLSVNASTVQYDLYSVVLREVTHALGFTSLINYDGNSKFGSAYKYYSRYDTFLKYNAASLISPASAGCSMYDYNFSGDQAMLHPGCMSIPPTNTGVALDHTDCTSTTINYTGSVTVPVYNSSCFETSSSLSHFEDECYINPAGVNYGNNNYFVMSNANVLGATRRFLRPEEKETLCDLGYNLSTQYGSSSQNSFYNYGVTCCLGNNVAGINDGISGNNYSFIAIQNENFTFTGILNNDVSYNSNYTTNYYGNLRFECLQDVYDTSATITSNGNTMSSVITFKTGVVGVHLLRYIPYDVISGQRGNITYVYIYVKLKYLCGTFPICDFVINGGFEDHRPFSPNNSNMEISQACYWYSGNSISNAEYYTSDTTNADYGVPNNSLGYQENSLLSPGHSYSGIYSLRDWYNGIPFNQIVATKLKTPLSPETTYQLKFDVSLAENCNQNPIKFQFYIGPEWPSPFNSPYSNLPMSTTGVFFENSTYSTDTQNWETITKTFTTGSATDLNYLYIGGLKNVDHINQNPPIPSNLATGSFYYIDNVSLVPIGDATINLPTTICTTNTLPDLSNYVQSAPPTGVFSGDGVVATGVAPNIVYSFNPTNLTEGSHTISYTYAPAVGCPLVTITDTINVTLCPLFDPIAPLCQGATAPALPTNPANIPTLTGTWSPATIDTTTAGTFTYTFTPTTGQSTSTTGTVTVTILPAPSTGAITGTTTVLATATTTLTPTVTGGVWTSADTSIATVDSNGIVTGVAAGATTIVYTITDSNGCTATVITTIVVLPNNTSCTDVTVWNGTSWSNGTPNTATYLNTAVVFTANFDTTEDLYACTVLVTNGATVNVNHIGNPLTTTTANTITVSNEVVVNAGATFFFDDDSSLVQINDTTNSGNIRYKRTTPPVSNLDYTYWCSPVAGQTLGGVSPFSPANRFYWWNPLIPNWVNIANTTAMEVGKGYIFLGPQYNGIPTSFDGYFSGVPNNGTITTPVYLGSSTQYPSSARSNLIGNPYPSAIDVDCFLSDPSNALLGGVVYLWTHDIPIAWTGNINLGYDATTTLNYNVNSYTALNRLGGVGSSITGFSNGMFQTNRSLGTIGAGQGFFVESSASGVATFRNSMRVGSQNQENSQFYKNNANQTLNTNCSTSNRHRLWLQIRDLTQTAPQFKQTLLGYSPNATTSVILDRDYDAVNFIANTNAINFYSLSPANAHLTIQGRYLPTPFNTTDVIPLGFTCKMNPATTSKDMEIATSEYDGLFATTNYYLRIKQPDGTYGYHDIKASPYPFTITQDEIDNTTKFALVFEVPAGGVILKTTLSTSKFVVTMSPNPFNKSFSLQLQSPLKDNVVVTIFDVLGKKLSSETMSVEDLKNAILGAGLASGIYQAVITQGAYKETIKIIKN